MGSWVATQLEIYKKKSNIMKDEQIRLKWEEFVNDARYKEYMMSDEDVWYNTLSKVKAYIDEHKSRPSSTSKDKAIKTLGGWITASRDTTTKRTYKL